MNREFLYELLETASVSGFEEEIQRKVIKYARGFADEVYTDEIADVVSIVNPDAKIKVMLSAHMDEIGLMVSHITEKGMLHVPRRVVFIRELILDRKSESCMREMWFTAQSETMAL